MSELPGMWDESDLQGGEADCAEDLLIVRKLKEENAALKARIAELEKQRDNLQRLLAVAVEEREALEQGERDE